MKPLRYFLRSLLCWLSLAAWVCAANVVVYTGQTGQTLYLRITNPAGSYVATALTEGSSGGEGNYAASESTIAALTGMSSASTGNGCAFRVYVGGTPSTTATDPIVAYGYLPWSGSAEISPPTSSSGGGSSVTPFLVQKGHTWRFDNPPQVTAPNIIQENVGFATLTFEMDLSGVLADNDSVAGTPAVTITDISGYEPTIGTPTLRADHKAVDVPLTGTSATANTYTVNVTFTTADGQQMTRKGRLQVQ